MVSTTSSRDILGDSHTTSDLCIKAFHHAGHHLRSRVDENRQQ